MKVAVIGAGKMGLPIACHLAGRGATVIACDLNEKLVHSINSGVCPFEEPGLGDLLQSGVSKGALCATTDTSTAVKESDVIIVIVPVLLTVKKDADLRQIHSVARQIGSALRPGAMVVFETTLPVGSTRGLIPFLEGNGRRVGVDLDLVYSPERVKSRLVLKHLAEAPKVIGGYDRRAVGRAMDFYSTFLGAPIIDVGTLEAAEFVKLAGMAYRDVNIALANELARYADVLGVNFETISAAANTDGEAFLLTPGIGVGGHCTPIYPYFLAHDARKRGVPVAITELARRINDDQPKEVIARFEEIWGPLARRRVMILGLGFRPQVKEHICSPAFQIRNALMDRGADVELWDPLYSPEEIRSFNFNPGELTDGPSPDVLILSTAHEAFLKLDFKDLVSKGLKAVIDGRNAWQPDVIQSSGAFYLGVGGRQSEK
jgi:nucleotide sugar dehydrogenase